MVERAKGRNGEAGEEPVMVSMVPVEVVVPTTCCVKSGHLQDKPHCSK